MTERLDGVRVLLVEDDDDVRLMLETFLAGQGADVYAAPHAAAALDGMARFRPSVLVLDLGLPDTDGARLLAQLRSRPEGAGKPALLITGRPRAETVELAHRAGFDAFLSKPVTVEAVARSIALLAERRQVGG